MSLVEKASYIKGLADGLDLNDSTKEGKIIKALIEVVDELCHAIDEIDEDLDYLNDYIEEIDEDLGDVQDYLADIDEDCDGECACDCDEDDCECCDGDFFEMECPSCGKTICFDNSIEPEELVCPACGEHIDSVVEEEGIE